MKIWKLVSGILSIILSVLIFFQSGLVGLANTLEKNSEVGGSAGVIVAVLLLTVGIVSIVTRNSLGKGGDITIIVMTAIAAIMGFAGAGSYADLKLWSGWCVVLLILAVVSIVLKRKEKKNEESK